MSGLEALGLACNVLQVIDLSHRTLVLCKDIYQGGSPDDTLTEYAKSLANLCIDEQQYYKTLDRHDSSHQDLIEIARKCNIAARELQEEAKFLNSPKARGDLGRSLKVAFLSIWRKDRLERSKRLLCDYQKIMETNLLARLW